MSVGNTILEKDAYKFAWVRRIKEILDEKIKKRGGNKKEWNKEEEEEWKEDWEEAERNQNDE